MKEESTDLSPKIKDSATRSVIREKLTELEQSLIHEKEEQQSNGEPTIDESFKKLFTSLRSGSQMFQEIEDEMNESQQTPTSTTMSSYQMFAEKEMEKLRDRILELERTSDNSNENKLKKAIRRASEIERASLTLKVENTHLKSELESLREEVKRLRTSNVTLKDQNEGLLVQLEIMKKSFMQTAKEKMELKSKLGKLSPSPVNQKKISNSTSSPSSRSPMTMRAKAFMGRFLSPKQ